MNDRLRSVLAERLIELEAGALILIEDSDTGYANCRSAVTFIFISLSGVYVTSLIRHKKPAELCVEPGQRYLGVLAPVEGPSLLELRDKTPNLRLRSVRACRLRAPQSAVPFGEVDDDSCRSSETLSPCRVH